jgi:bifunctional non-homologous end joining protein LigD
MKALGSDRVPTGPWRCEVKLDGFRAVAVLNRGGVELWSRNRKSLTEDFPEVVAGLQKLKCRDAVIDGEIVALDGAGRSRFQLLQNNAAGASPIVYYAFDIMHLDGRSLIGLPLKERSAILAGLVKDLGTSVRISPVFEVEPAALFAAATKNGLEGIVAKQPASIYEPDRRSGAWVKCKVLAEQEFIIGGFTPPKRSREHFGALLVGYREGDRLVYAGKVGTGFDAGLLRTLHEKLERIRRKESPFGDLPLLRKARFGTGMGPAEMREVTWVEPSLVAQIKFAEWTSEGLLRQPVFLGLRSDKAAGDVHREPGPARRRPKRAAAGA